MKKLLALLIAMMMVFALAACGGGNETPDPSGSNDNTPSSSQQQEQPSSAPDDSEPNDSIFPELVTADNYQDIMKQYYGMDFTAPEGWTFKSGMLTNINPSYSFDFEYSGSENNFYEAYKAFKEQLFSATEAMGNKANRQEEIVAEIPMMGIWYYNIEENGYDVQVIPTDYSSSKTANVSLVSMQYN